MSFRENFEWQHKYLEHIRNIVGPLLLEPASLALDTQEATDLLVLTARDMWIGCRIRRAGYSERYPWEFTIRSHLDNGHVTELAKITDGWGDWLFYGHADADELPFITRWYVVDLHAWRAHMIRDKGAVRKGVKSNGDGTHFAWFDIRSFPPRPPILISSSHDIEVAA